MVAFRHGWARKANLIRIRYDKSVKKPCSHPEPPKLQHMELNLRRPIRAPGLCFGVHMELSVAFFAIAVPAILFAGVSKGGFGSGAAFAATPLLALIIEPALAVSFALPLLMIMDLTSLRIYWRLWDARQALLLGVAATFGIVLGGLFFRIAEPDLMRLLIGGIAVGFVLFQLGVARWSIRPARKGGILSGAFWGTMGGFTSTISHAGGPPVSMHLLTQNLTKLAYQATSVIVFFWINLAKLPLYIGLGLFTRETLLANLALVPVAIAGTYLGAWAHRQIPEKTYFAVAYSLLLTTGTYLIYRGLT